MRKYIIALTLATSLLTSCVKDSVPLESVETSSLPRQKPPYIKTIVIPENWKTYVDTEWNITFRYPPDWTIAVMTGMDDSHVALTVTPDNPLGPEREFQINHWNIPYDKSYPSSIFEKYTVHLNENKGTRFKYNDTNTGIQKVTQIDMSDPKLVFIQPYSTEYWEEDVYSVVDSVIASLEATQ